MLPMKTVQWIKRSLSKSKSMDSSGSTEEEASTAVAASQHMPSTLSIFHEDILLHILSFVADVPFEIDCEF